MKKTFKNIGIRDFDRAKTMDGLIEKKYPIKRLVPEKTSSETIQGYITTRKLDLMENGTNGCLQMKTRRARKKQMVLLSENYHHHQIWAAQKVNMGVVLAHYDMDATIAFLVRFYPILQ